MWPPFDQWPQNPVSQRYLLVEWLDARLLPIGFLVFTVWFILDSYLHHRTKIRWAKLTTRAFGWLLVLAVAAYLVWSRFLIWKGIYY